MDANLAYRRHFPAINWLLSYSLYVDKLDEWYSQNIARDWGKLRTDMMRILQEESELEEIVRLVGVDALSPKDRVTLEAAKSIREDFLHQDAFHEVDTYATLNKQYQMLKLILSFYYKGMEAIKEGAELNKLFAIPARGKIGRAKYIEEKLVSDEFSKIENELVSQIEALVSKEGV